jgi:hypothetical protein
MEKIVVSVAQAYKFSSNLEAAPLMVQLVKEGEKWRLRLASPVVGLAGGGSPRYGDYYLGTVGSGYYLRGERVKVANRRWDMAGQLPELFEHQSTANNYFAAMGVCALVKDLNLLQLKLQKQSAISFSAASRLVQKQLKKVYWWGFTLGYDSKKTKLFSGSARLGAAMEKRVQVQVPQLALQAPTKRDYEKFLQQLYAYPPMEYFSHNYAGYKKWTLFWGCAALGILGVNRAHGYVKKTKRWYKLDPDSFFLPLQMAFPPFYRRSYQRYKENGAICSGYPDYLCETDAGDEWRKAIDWFPDSVERKDNGPLKKALYVGHNNGVLPARDLGLDDYRPPEGL